MIRFLKYSSFFILFIGFSCSITPLESIQEETEQTDGLGYLNAIKQKITETLNEDSYGIWPRGDQLHTQATMKFAELSLLCKRTPTQVARKTLDQVETFLYEIACLDVSEMWQNGELVMLATQTMNNQLAQTARNENPKGNDAQILIKTSLFIGFITKSFLPEVQIHVINRSLIQMLYDLVTSPIQEYPFLSGVFSTLAAVWAYGQLSEEPADLPGICNCLCHKNGTRHTFDTDDTEVADEMLKASAEEIAKLKKLPQDQWAVQGIAVPRQSGATCTYHAAFNACSVASALAQGRKLDEIMQETTFAENTKEAISALKTKWATEFNKHGELLSGTATKSNLTAWKKEHRKTVLDQGMATGLAKYILGEKHPGKMDIFTNIDRDDLYFNMMDYRQHLAQRQHITGGRECIRKLSNTNNLKKLREQFKTSESFYDADGEGCQKGDFHLNADSSFVGCAVDLSAFNGMVNSFVSPRNESGRPIKIGQWTDSWLAAIQAYRSGKTLVLGWLSFSGNSTQGMGHWTTVIIVPHTRSATELTTVYHLDSMGNGNALPRFCAQFLHDCRYFELPTAEERKQAQYFYNYLKYGKEVVKKYPELTPKPTRRTQFGNFNEA
ncbi:hypothetical protein FJ366_02955 [Candidatus Dependentiae bacterium]|nr:hypothetical protein [Candidatus Dependentiae bacterium]